MTFLNDISDAIYDKLAAGTALTALLANGSNSIWDEQPPDNETMDYVIFNHQGGGDENLTPSRMKSIVYFVRGYSKISARVAGSIDGAIDDILHGGSISVTGYNNFWLNRELEFKGTETLPSGEKSYMAGAFYRARLDR